MKTARQRSAVTLSVLASSLIAGIFPVSLVVAAEIFTEAARDSGIDFVHFNGMTGEFYMAENVGSGAALFDYDNDGDLDLDLVQGRMIDPERPLADALFPLQPGQTLFDRLYRNDLVIREDGTRSLRFTDVTEESGIRAGEYGMGAIAADYNGDGWVDLLVTSLGKTQLYHNNGDGSFSDVTDKAGVDTGNWSVGATFLDYDRDGHLDLYIGNYLDFTVANNKKCIAPSGAPDYCSPRKYNAQRDHLFHNRGDGTFEDVTTSARVDRGFGPALGIIAADFNGDGWQDIYVANDAAANQLWINRKDGTFVDDALLAGVAVNMEGAEEASMGVDAADFDGDGDEDLFMTHLEGETNTIYVNDGNGWFEDRSLATDLGAASKPFTAFGTAWLDYDNDGWLDLLVANGGVNSNPALVRAGDKYPLHQTNQLFANLGNGRFREVTAEAGKVFEQSEVSRGAAFGDIDNDGDPDVVVTNNNGPARLLINNIGNRNHWLGLELLDSDGRTALGARVAVHRSKGPVLWRRVRTDGSYASSNDPRVLVGLGDSGQIDRLIVYWPDGSVEQWREITLDGYTTLRQGTGSRVEQGTAGKTEPGT